MFYASLKGINQNAEIRYDIIQGLRNLYNVAGDKSLEAKAQAPIEMVTDAKYRKKYAGIWKTK